ncbi:hypothetical protein [Streptomyces phytophilus]|uniref:hypothetical protein n=1 Tax=Streptomyces phytophilus TaxID=722715 RepID=UPI0015F10A31|nr:hypothetical protein [Streptomyces phytophilus]
MRIRTIAAAAAALALPLTACGSDDDGTPAAESKPAGKYAGCDDPDITEAEYNEKCLDGAPADADKPLEFGTTAKDTAGAYAEGTLDITPSTVVYAASGTDETPEGDVFSVVVIKDHNKGDVAAAESAMLENGGWQWIAADGQAIEEANTDASLGVSPNSFLGGGEVQPGTWDWGSVVFDLTEAQRAGGTLTYVDGAGTAYRWAMPDADTGPEIAKLKKDLAWSASG